MDVQYKSIVTYSSLSSTPNADLKECFICREEDQNGQDGLQHFCDCKDLTAHQICLLKWIQKGTGNEDRQRCKACTATYQLQEGSVWRILLCQWKNLILFVLLMTIMVMVFFAVYKLKSLKDPPPDPLFIAAALCCGVIAETLLIKCFIWYCTNQYNKAKMSSYSIKARTVKQSASVSFQCPANQGSSTSVGNSTEVEKQTTVSPKNVLNLSLLV
ncbi:uncharacterized protein WCC33_009076 [Rhinophrynus dorsalis]